MMTTGFDTELGLRTYGLDPVPRPTTPHRVPRNAAFSWPVAWLRCTHGRTGMAARPLHHVPCAHLPPGSPLTRVGRLCAIWRSLPSACSSARDAAHRHHHPTRPFSTRRGGRVSRAAACPPGLLLERAGHHPRQGRSAERGSHRYRCTRPRLPRQDRSAA